MDENELAGVIIGAAIEVHRALGPGLLESAYHGCLTHEFSLRGLRFETEVPIALDYKGLLIGHAYQADFIVDNRVIVELKSVGAISDIHKAQLLTYLRLTGKRLGLLIQLQLGAAQARNPSGCQQPVVLRASAPPRPPRSSTEA